MTADAGSRGNLGNVDLEGGQQPRRQRRLRAFLQVELGGFAQVGQGFLDGVALARGADLRALRHVDLVFPVQDRRQALGGWRSSWSPGWCGLQSGGSHTANVNSGTNAAGIALCSRQRIAALRPTRSARLRGFRRWLRHAGAAPACSRRLPRSGTAETASRAWQVAQGIQRGERISTQGSPSRRLVMA